MIYNSLRDTHDTSSVSRCPTFYPIKYLISMGQMMKKPLAPPPDGHCTRARQKRSSSSKRRKEPSPATIGDMADAHGEKTRIIWFLKTTDFCWVWLWMFEVPDFQSGHFHFVNCLGGITAWWSSLHGFHLFGDRVLESTSATQAVNKDLPQQKSKNQFRSPMQPLFVLISRDLTQ